MEIRSISEKIFKTSPNKIENNQNQSNHSNPFGVSFNGNVVKADVFESKEKSNVAFKGAALAEKVSNRSKMVISTIVGSVNSMNQAISSRLDSVVSFGRRIGERVTMTWNCMNPTNWRRNLIEVGRRSTEMVKTNILDRSLKNHSVEALSEMFEELASARCAKEVIA